MCLILDFLECLELGDCVLNFGFFGMGDWVFSFGIVGIFGSFWNWEMVCLPSEFLELRQSHKQLCSGIL